MATLADRLASLITAIGADVKQLSLRSNKIYASWPGNLSQGFGQNRIYIDEVCTLVSIAITLGTAPAGANVVIDVKKNGVSIFGTLANRPTIADGSTSDVTPGTDASSATFAVGDILSFDVVSIGSSTPGADLTILTVLRPLGV